MLSRFRKNEKGFTLVELMIVVAIIGILAAIAIPQFASYRQKSFNSSALSDLRNLCTAEAALFAEYTRFGVTQEETAAGPFDPADPGGAGGAAVLGGNTTADGIATVDFNGTARGVPIAVSNGVTVIANVNVKPEGGAAGTPTAYGAAAKHLQGDTTYGADSDSSSVYQNSKLVAAGTALATTNFTVSVTPNNDDFSGVTGWSAR